MAVKRLRVTRVLRRLEGLVDRETVMDVLRDGERCDKNN